MCVNSFPLDGYTARNLAMVLYPLYGYFIYKHFNHPKWLPWITGCLVIFLILQAGHSRSEFTGLYAMTFMIIMGINNHRKWIITFFMIGMMLMAYHHIGDIKTTYRIYQQAKEAEQGIVYVPHSITPQAYCAKARTLLLGPANKEGNVVFRLFIWQDMIREMMDHQAWLGMGLSHPLRSRQLEILHWGESEWKRDGWISAHNSYLYVIYRLGIIGIILIGCLLFELYDAYIEFIRHEDTLGILLCSCVSYWLVCALTREEFQLPYYAIPLWTTYGLMMYRAATVKVHRQWTHRDAIDRKILGL